MVGLGDSGIVQVQQRHEVIAVAVRCPVAEIVVDPAAMVADGMALAEQLLDHLLGVFVVVQVHAQAVARLVHIRAGGEMHRLVAVVENAGLLQLVQVADGLAVVVVPVQHQSALAVRRAEQRGLLHHLVGKVGQKAMQKDAVGAFEQVGQRQVDEHRLALAPAVDAGHDIAVARLQQHLQAAGTVGFQHGKALRILGVARDEAGEGRFLLRQLGRVDGGELGSGLGIEVAPGRYAQQLHRRWRPTDLFIVRQLVLEGVVIAIAQAQHLRQA